MNSKDDENSSNDLERKSQRSSRWDDKGDNERNFSGNSKGFDRKTDNQQKWDNNQKFDDLRGFDRGLGKNWDNQRGFDGGSAGNNDQQRDNS